MAYLEVSELQELYTQAKSDARVWKEHYSEFERLANNDLAEDLDSNLPETNDGSLAASLFKLPKRIISGKLAGRVKATDRDDTWITELANLQLENKIIPNAKSQAKFHRKWKDAVRKAAIYGSVPLITLFTERGNYRGADFIVALPQDVTLEPGKVSDQDSDVVFWDVYYTKLQLKNMIEEAKRENKEAKDNGRESYSKWNLKVLNAILKGEKKVSRETQDTPKQMQDAETEQSGFHFYVAFQRGVEAPFYMISPDYEDEPAREWSNVDPTGDIPVHYLFCYQDFINPYGIGIVKLAGGTQNVLDYMRQADVLSTQLGLRPPVEVAGDAESADIDSIVYEQDAIWFTGNAIVKRQEVSTQVYRDLPARIGMYKTSLDQMIPSGDTSISADSGDPNYSKTPAGVKFQASNLSIDDEDFKDNTYETYADVVKSMVNIHFANMEGIDLMTLTADERDIMMKAGIEFPVGEDGEMSTKLEIEWDKARAEFDFEIDPEADKTKEDEVALTGLSQVVEITKDPVALQTISQSLAASGKRLDMGELYVTLIGLLTDNDKIIVDISPEDQAAMDEQNAMGGAVDPTTGQPVAPVGPDGMPIPPVEEQVIPEGVPALPAGMEEEAAPEIDPKDAEALANIQAVMEEHGVDEDTAATMLLAEAEGHDPADILAYVQSMQAEEQGEVIEEEVPSV